jgi:hypothetical protein
MKLFLMIDASDDGYLQLDEWNLLYKVAVYKNNPKDEFRTIVIKRPVK